MLLIYIGCIDVEVFKIFLKIFQQSLYAFFDFIIWHIVFIGYSYKIRTQLDIVHEDIYIKLTGCLQLTMAEDLMLFSSLLQVTCRAICWDLSPSGISHHYERYLYSAQICEDLG